MSRNIKLIRLHTISWTGGESATRMSMGGPRSSFIGVQQVHWLTGNLTLSQRFISKNGHWQRMAQNLPASTENHYTQTCTDLALLSTRQKRTIYLRIQRKYCENSLDWLWNVHPVLNNKPIPRYSAICVDSKRQSLTGKNKIPTPVPSAMNLKKIGIIFSLTKVHQQ